MQLTVGRRHVLMVTKMRHWREITIAVSIVYATPAGDIEVDDWWLSGF